MYISDSLIKSFINHRKKDAHKGDFGHLAIVAGCERYCGAAVLCTTAASRVGSGFVTLCSVDKVCDIASVKSLETILCRLNRTQNGTISKDSVNKIMSIDPTALLIGCGLSKDADTVSLVTNLISTAKCPIVLDADALNVIADNLDILKHKKSQIIITPHVGEMARLTQLSINDIIADRQKVAKDFSEKFDVVTVLKGHETVIATPEGKVYINPTGNPGMAKGGSGDVLAGMIGGFLAQGIDYADAAICGVYLHGLAGDIARDKYTEWAMLPSDTINMIPKAFKKTLCD